MIPAGARIVLWSREAGVLLGTIHAIRIMASGRPMYDIVLDCNRAITTAETIVFPVAGLPMRDGKLALAQLSSQIGTA